MYIDEKQISRRKSYRRAPVIFDVLCDEITFLGLDEVQRDWVIKHYRSEGWTLASDTMTTHAPELYPRRYQVSMYRKADDG